ncbi:RNA helicase family protein [Perilla frutescens var. frutescens]|nr:RNA helicase family protein [Perilla frutescens var. frutescens]
MSLVVSDTTPSGLVIRDAGFRGCVDSVSASPDLGVLRAEAVDEQLSLQLTSMVVLALDSFDEPGLPGDATLNCCKAFGKPSPIQSRSWLSLLDDRDLVRITTTGSSKTLAFGISAMTHVLNKRKSNPSKKVNPPCLVLSPARELAQQNSDVAQPITAILSLLLSSFLAEAGLALVEHQIQEMGLGST